MVSHYHICIGPQESLPVADTTFDNYEDSIECFVNLSNTLFKQLRGSPEDLTIEQALEATMHGEGRGAYVGAQSLTLYWLRCDEKEHPIPAWN